MAQAFDSGAFDSGAFEAGSAPLVYTLDAQPTSFSLTGFNATTTVTRRVVASPASYTLTGQPATTSVQRLLKADAGSISLTGFPASLADPKLLIADSASYGITGVDAVNDANNINPEYISCYEKEAIENQRLAQIKIVRADKIQEFADAYFNLINDK